MNRISHPNNHEYGYGNMAAAQHVYCVEGIFQGRSVFMVGRSLPFRRFNFHWRMHNHAHYALYDHAYFVGLSFTDTRSLILTYFL
jgi:hypothetical protein